MIGSSAISPSTSPLHPPLRLRSYGTVLLARVSAPKVDQSTFFPGGLLLQQLAVRDCRLILIFKSSLKCKTINSSTQELGGAGGGANRMTFERTGTSVYGG